MPAKELADSIQDNTATPLTVPARGMQKVEAYAQEVGGDSAALRTLLLTVDLKEVRLLR